MSTRHEEPEVVQMEFFARKMTELHEKIYDLKFAIEDIKLAVIRSGGELVYDEKLNRWSVRVL
jgi:hypothetical protein